MTAFTHWLAGLWWVLLLALIASVVPLGPLIAVCYEAAEQDRDRPAVFAATRVLLVLFAWVVACLTVSALCNIAAVFVP